MIKDIRKKHLIITVCFTGEGASERLKQIIMKALTLSDAFEIVSLDILDRKAFMNAITEYKLTYEILAIVGTVEIEERGIPFISAIEILAGEGLVRLKGLIENQDAYIRIADSLEEHIKTVSSKTLIGEVRQFIVNNERALKVMIPNDVKIGIALHLSFLIDHLLQGIVSPPKGDLENYKSQYSREMELSRKQIKALEHAFNVMFSESDVAYLTKMFISNHQSV
jgi:transcriptional regulatory protein LevR